MSLETLERDILKDVAAAGDEAALEALRVSALGKKGSISERLKGLGKMSPEERKTAGAALNALKDRVTAALEVRRASLRDAGVASNGLTRSVHRSSAVRRPSGVLSRCCAPIEGESKPFSRLGLGPPALVAGPRGSETGS